MEITPMANRRTDTSLSPTDQQAVFDSVNTIRTRVPFIIDLTIEERRFLLKMGDSTVEPVS
jgi:hypothetical protein